jgi:hypothetical protein
MRKLSKIATGQRGRNGADRHQIRRGDGRGRDEDFYSPPHRSRRALLTHRAPPSGQTSYDERFSLVVRRAAIIRIDAAFRLSVRTAAASFNLGDDDPRFRGDWVHDLSILRSLLRLRRLLRLASEVAIATISHQGSHSVLTVRRNHFPQSTKPT